MNEINCCTKPNISTMHETLEEINRVCLNCQTHWYGDPASPVRYTRKEWDALLEVCA